MISRMIKPFLIFLKLQHQVQQQQQPDSCPFPPPPTPTPLANNSIKVIKSDGLIFLFHRPVLVSQLNLDHPDYLVCPEDSFYIGKKIPSLSPDHKLLPGHNYFLLPRHIFHSVLSFPTFASFASHPFNRAAAAFCKPFHIHKSPSGFLRVQVSDHFISLLLSNQQQQKQMGNNIRHHNNDSIPVGTTGILCTTPQLDKDYRQLVAPSTKNWKPKLDTIAETTTRGRKRKFSSFRIIKRSSSSSSSSSSTTRNKTPSAQMPRSRHHFSIANFKFRLKNK